MWGTGVPASTARVGLVWRVVWVWVWGSSWSESSAAQRLCLLLPQSLHSCAPFWALFFGAVVALKAILGSPLLVLQREALPHLQDYLVEPRIASGAAVPPVPVVPLAFVFPMFCGGCKGGQSEIEVKSK